MELSDFACAERIEKGWSSDQKYKVTDAQGTPFLLRISPMEQRLAKQVEFERMGQLAALGVPMCRPVAFDTGEQGVYALQSWIDGEDAEPVMATLPEDRVYAYGCSAGQILRQIHSIPAPPDQPDWEARFNRKIDRKIASYRACPIAFDGAEQLIAYLNANRALLHGRPQCWQHGDYHIGNMMLDRTGQLVIIDFNRSDFGDPWEEFNRIVWCAQACPAFACGMVDGYFEGSPPRLFWQLLELYIASNTLSSVPWAIPFGEQEIGTMLRQAQDVLGWYGNMTHPVPTWYRARNQKGVQTNGKA